MDASFVISAVGLDRVGIVAQISQAILEVGGNIGESRMALLGGEFAVILLFSAEADREAEVRQKLERAAAGLGLALSVKRAGEPARTAPRRGAPHKLTVSSADHPGIVQQISRLLAERGVNVQDLQTAVKPAPESGADLFTLTLSCLVPENVPVAGLDRALQDLGERENFDLVLERI